MSGINAINITGCFIFTFCRHIAAKLDSLSKVVRCICIFSEDTLYRRYFINEFIPSLYVKHIAENYKNCVFCEHLKKSGCHRHCLKCVLGKHEKCASLLPGNIDCDSIYPCDESLRIPWYYTEACGSFSRLPQNNYLRNFNSQFGLTSIINYETLESLEKGLLSGERPCHVCASEDYEIYRKCSSQEDFHVFSPCTKITELLADYYLNRNTTYQVSPKI